MADQGCIASHALALRPSPRGRDSVLPGFEPRERPAPRRVLIRATSGSRNALSAGSRRFRFARPRPPPRRIDAPRATSRRTASKPGRYFQGALPRGLRSGLLCDRDHIDQHASRSVGLRSTDGDHRKIDQAHRNALAIIQRTRELQHFYIGFTGRSELAFEAIQLGKLAERCCKLTTVAEIARQA